MPPPGLSGGSHALELRRGKTITTTHNDSRLKTENPVLLRENGAFGDGVPEWDRWDSNPEPKDYESPGDASQPAKRQKVTKRRSRRCTTGCTNSPENERGKAGGESVS